MPLPSPRGRSSMLRSRPTLARLCTVAAVIAAGAVAALVQAPGARAANLPPHFAEQTVWTGLNMPTNIEFAPDGRVFVAEKGGVIKVFDSVSDSTPTVFADLSRNVHPLHD